MREIRFRAKTINRGQWIYGDLLRAGTEPSDGEFTINYWDEKNGWMNENVQPDTIGQFTGLKDKNGKDIYYGDIVKVKDLQFVKYGRVLWYDEGAHHYVEYGRNNHTMLGYITRCGVTIEVVGNMYENPELIK